MTTLVDAHCHLQSERLPDTPAHIVAEAAAAGVEAIVMAGVEPAGWRRQAALAATFPTLWPVLGIHPWIAATLDDAGLAAMMGELETALDDTPRVVAIGESGLDGLTPDRVQAMDQQIASLRLHLALAERRRLPLVLHAVKAQAPILAVLKETGLPCAGAVIHSFSGSVELAREYVKLGLYVSFSGTLTFPQSRRLREAAAVVPGDRLLIETDAPDQSPVGHRGEPNRPAYLPEVAAALAEVRGCSLTEIAAVTTENARRLYGLASPVPD